MYDSLLSRSFSKQEKRKLGYGGLLLFFLLFITFCTVFEPFFSPLPVVNLRLSIEAYQKHNILNVTASSSNFIFSNEVRSRKNAILENPSSSSQKLEREFERRNHESWNDISSSQPIVNESMMKHAANGNTSNLTLISNNNEELKVDINNEKDLSIFSNTSNYHRILLNEICQKQETSDWCKIEGDIRINGNLSTVFIVSSQQPQNNSWTIRPYARKADFAAMNNVREWSIKPESNPPKCSQTHDIPAILFSVGGYSGNYFHAFTDVIIPFYSTAQRFNGLVQLLVTDHSPWWLYKFRKILKGLSKYEIIDADRNSEIHCFKSITVGLKRLSNKELTMDPSEIPRNSMKDFRQFLRNSYSLNKTRALKINNRGEKKKPRLVIISRNRTRAFTNVDSIAKMARRLGFKVVIHEPGTDVSTSAQVINSCDVVLGVHGAGLTNMVFLPENAILVQVIPFGGAEWTCKTSFEEPSKDMNIRYLDYKISINESSLRQQYPSDHVVLRNPDAIHKQGWGAFKSIYLDKQNVKLDLNRFRPTLVKALRLLRQ